jgi:S-formylglutathione hydrolase FrmB
MQPSCVRLTLSVAIALAAVALTFCPRALFAQPAGGKLEQIRVHGAALDGNLSGDDATRDVFVYLPPSYAREPTRRYPVVYFLHGYTATAQAYVKFVDLPQAADAAIAAGGREMIIVLPDAFTKWSGSMYSNSVTTGDWESYVAHDLVAYVDSHYRTIAKRESRGLSGHSMGGYGTWRIGMKRPDVFGALYAMSSCCLLIDPARGGDPVTRPRASGESGATPPPPTPAPTQQPQPRGPAAGFANALSAQAAAWAPNPDNPPDYFDLPTKNGEIDALIAGKWLANSPLLLVDQYVPSLKRYRAIALDVGDRDPLGADNVKLDAELTRLQIEHGYELYEGDHTSRVKERFAAKVLPFFSQHLDAGK